MNSSSDEDSWEYKRTDCEDFNPDTFEEIYSVRGERIIDDTGVLIVFSRFITSLREIAQNYGEKVTEFKWAISRRAIKFSPSQLAEILNNMPNLTCFKFDGSYKNFEWDDEEVSKGIVGKLEKLTRIQIMSGFDDIFKFFTKFLAQNSIIVCYIQFYGSAISPATLRNFFESQKKIQKLKLEEKVNVLQFVRQREELKFLKIKNGEFSNETLKLIPKFSNLEVLKFDIEDLNPKYIVDWNPIENLANLKEISIEIWGWDCGFYDDLRNLRNENVEKLIVPGDFSDEFLEAISVNFPNLKDLELTKPTQKLNLIAKIFPNLEKLTVGYSKPSLICESDTGILNEDLKQLKLSFYIYYENCFEHFLDVLEIFLGLEVFDFHDSSRSIKISKLLFLKLNSLEKLKVLKLSTVGIVDFIEYVDEFKELAVKLEEIEIILFHSEDQPYQQNDCNFNEEYIERVKEIVKEFYKLEIKWRVGKCLVLTKI